MREIISIIALIIALVIAIQFTVPLSDLLTATVGFKDVLSSFSTFAHISAEGPLASISFAVSFLVLLFATFFTAEAVNYYAVTTIMFPIFIVFTLFEKMLAGLLGFVRGYVFSLIFILILAMTPLIKDAAWTQSILIPAFMPKANELANMVKTGGFPSWN